MKVTMDRNALLKALSHVQSVVERRPTIPILANLLLRAEGGKLSLSATDMDLEIVEAAPAQVEQDGRTTAPAHTLYDIARKLPEGSQVELAYEAGSQTLKLTAGRAKFQLSCLPVEDFPALSESAGEVAFALPAKDLRQLIDKTRFAISTEETRYYLNGIYFHAAPAEGDAPALLRAAATDGHRLARAQADQPDGAADMPGIIVPRKAVGELRKLLEDSDEPVDIALSSTKIRLSFGQVVLTTKLIDGTFPDYERVIPTGNDRHLAVEKKAFQQAVDRVATIATEKSRAVKLAVEASSLTVSATSQDQGQASETLEVAFDAQPLEIGFNANYLMEILRHVDGAEARLDLADAAAPTIIRDSADETCLYVLMPMRV